MNGEVSRISGPAAMIAEALGMKAGELTS